MLSKLYCSIFDLAAGLLPMAQDASGNFLSKPYNDIPLFYKLPSFNDSEWTSSNKDDK
jgi:hypothetical protein